jgi:hypothetical protein
MNWYDGIVITMAVCGLWAIFFMVKAMLDQRAGRHDYLSTACLHEFHTECRKMCKFCQTRCRCSCHRPLS